MLIHGTRYTELGKGRLPSPCMHCGKENTVTLTIGRPYRHVFFIPFFPKRRVGFSTCSHCKQELSQDEMPATYREALAALGSTVRNPWWHWTGSVLLVAFIGFIAFQVNADGKRETQRVRFPHAGDEWTIRTPDKAYTLWRIVAVDSNAVVYREHTMQVDLIKGLKQLRAEGEAGYDSVRITLPRTEAIRLHDQDTLIMVRRD